MRQRITPVKEFFISKEDVLALADIVEEKGIITDRNLSKWLLKHTNNHALVVRTEILEDFVAALEIQEDLVKNCFNHWSGIKMLLPDKDGSGVHASYKKWLYSLRDTLELKIGSKPRYNRPF